VPFHTTVVVGTSTRQRPRRLMRLLTPRVRDLMECLRGEEAS
jgi:hypothetical protein